MPWSLLPSMAAGRAAGAVGRRLGKQVSDFFELPPGGEEFTVKLFGVVLGGVASAVVSTLLLDPIGGAAAAAANADGFDSGTAVPDGAVHPHHAIEPKFGYEGFYRQGVDHNGNIVIQSGTGGPVLQSTGEHVSPNDVTWKS
ncbi:hypothetical protein ACH4ZX_37740 [Streptomyces sp. NPDC020490]|uniref:hypothetical protein n=1 Tax=Streptomyces sp. NPDC020490 TaxID=3365078 RepID=UPI0037A4D0E9